MTTWNFPTYNRRSFCVLLLCLLLQCTSAFVPFDPNRKVSFRSKLYDIPSQLRPRDIFRKDAPQRLPFMASSLVVPVTKSSLLAPFQPIFQWVSSSLSVTMPSATTLFALAWSTQHWQVNLLKHVFTMISTIYAVSAFKELWGQTKGVSKTILNYLVVGAWTVGGAAWLARTLSIPVYAANLAKHTFSLWAMLSLLSVVRGRIVSVERDSESKMETTAVVEPIVEETISTRTSQKETNADSVVDIPKEETTNEDLFFEPIEEEIVQTAADEEPIQEDELDAAKERLKKAAKYLQEELGELKAPKYLADLQEELSELKASKYLANLQEELAELQLDAIPAEFKKVYERTQEKLTKYQMNEDNFTFGPKKNGKKQP